MKKRTARRKDTVDQDRELHRTVGRLFDRITSLPAPRPGAIVVELTGKGGAVWRLEPARRYRKAPGADVPVFFARARASKVRSALGKCSRPNDFLSAADVELYADPAFANEVARALLKPLTALVRARRKS